MIDHAAARRTIASSLDFEIEPLERVALDDHLRSCPTCRAYAAGLRADAAVLREVDLGPVPTAVRANVAIAAERDRHGRTGRWAAFVVVGALLLVALGSGAFGGGGRPSSTVPGGNAIRWATEVVDIRASDFWIEANGRRFTASVEPVSVVSDPGDMTYRTLEVEWSEHGVPMRLNLYFGGDETTWWVSEIRTSDGRPNPAWAEIRGRWFTTPLGAAWTGDVDITLTDVSATGSTPTRLHMAGATISTRPQTAYIAPPGGGIPLPADVDPTAPGGAVFCDPVLQLTPTQAQEVLLGRNLRLSWRFMSSDGSGPPGWTGPLQPPPTGVIQGAAVGTSGELVLFVAPADQGPPKMLPSDCPVVDPS